MQRDRGVRIASRIDDDSGRVVGMGLVDEIDQFAFAIGLPAIGLEAELRGGVSAKLLDVGELGMAVGLGLTGSQQIEVRAVEHVNRIGSCSGHPNPGNAAGVVVRDPRGGGVIGNNGGKGKPLGLRTALQILHPSRKKLCRSSGNHFVNQGWDRARRPWAQKKGGHRCPPECSLFARGQPSITSTISSVRGSTTKIWSRTRMNS